MRRSHRLQTVVLFVMLAGAACGQKSGVSEPNDLAAPTVPGSERAPVVPTEAAADPFPAATLPPSGGQVTPATRAPTADPAGRQPSGTSGPAASTSAGTAPAESARRSAEQAVVPADDRTGVTATEIVIGVHAPLTGAAPIPVDTVDKARDLYWKWVRDRGGIHGRNVRIVFRDDQYNPTRAVQVCREMVEQERVFILLGLGADQVAPCARYATGKGVPYLSLGGSEVGLDQLKTYFAVSMSYPAQSPMMARLIKGTGKTKVGIVVSNTSNFDDTHRSIVTAVRAAGLQIVRNSRLNKNADQGQALAEANALRQAGAEVVYVMVSPSVFLNLAHAGQGQAYNPQWVGPGLSAGVNLIAEFGCPSVRSAKFLSPFPQLDVIDRFDPEYRVAYRQYNNGEEADDLGLIGWGLAKVLHQMFLATGPDLGRARFMAALESGREFTSNVLPPLRYGPGRHFGASQAHLLEADCDQRRYRTLAAFVNGL
jgi:branched-chain amino acid transport system substrate-binding protein